MSLKRKYRTKITIPKLQLPRANVQKASLPIPTSPSLQLLRQAMEKAAVEGNGNLDTQYFDCLGKGHSCWLAVRTEGFQRGVGLEVEQDGSVSFEFDDASLAQPSGSRDLIGQARFIFDETSVARALCREIAQHYAVLAIARSLQEGGCDIELTSIQEGCVQGGKSHRVIIRGRDKMGRVRQVSVGPKAEVEVDMIGFRGDDCVAAETKLRAQLQEFGLQLEVTAHHQKERDALAGFQPRVSEQTGGTV